MIADTYNTPMPSTLLSVDAMACRFEIAIYDSEEPSRLRAAAEYAVDEIIKCDNQLSRFRPVSDVSYINSKAHKRSVRVEPHLFETLLLCSRIHKLSNGLYDITIAPLMDLWLSAIKNSNFPTEEDILTARENVGMDKLELDESTRTIKFKKEKVMIDLGSVGKGIALDRACAVLFDAGVKSALIHGGTSSVVAVGSFEGNIAVKNPDVNSNNSYEVFKLNNSSLSVSALRGRCFEYNKELYGHIINPLTGFPTKGVQMAVVVGSSPIVCEILSTALHVCGLDFLKIIEREYPDYDGYIY